MHIEKLSLINFKNYSEAALTFSENINCLVGPNGSGKTNILDAIHYLSLTKSAHNPMDGQNIKFDESFFSVKGVFKTDEEQLNVVCYFKEGSKKSFKVNKKDYDKLSEHIGRFPVVLITPYDSDTIRQGSEIRRKFFDTIIAQIDTAYLHDLIKYGANLKQRNSALKQFNKARKIDYTLLDLYDQNLIEIGRRIFERREEFLKHFLPLFITHYQFISERKEEVLITYKSQFDTENLAKALLDNRDRDVATERSNFGVHRDDFRFIIQDQLIKKFGSQGQQKSFSIALKLAQFDVIKECKGFSPILLLDDIFDKLDTGRISKLLELVNDKRFGQIFITDAREERTRKLMSKHKSEVQFHLVHKGVVLDEDEEV